MAKDNNDFNTSVEALLKGMDGFLSSKTVVGEAIHVNDSVILPLVDVQFGVGAEAFTNDKKNNSLPAVWERRLRLPPYWSFKTARHV